MSLERDLGIPGDFGGIAAAWVDDTRAVLLHIGHGKIIEAIGLTPLNALQALKMLDHLVEDGRGRGYITVEHERQSDALPGPGPADKAPARADVDEVAGPE